MKTQVLNNKVTFISIAIFILLSLGTIGFLWNQNQQLKKMILSYQTQSQPTTPPIPEPVINYNGNYSNKEFGVSFDYPKSYSLEEEYFSTNKDSYQITLISPHNSNADIDSNELKIVIFIETNKLNQSLNEYVNNFKKETINAKLISENNVTIAGFPAKKLVWEGMGTNTTYHLLTNKNVIKIIKYPNKTSQQFEFDQILSTFKFLDAAPTPISKACTMEAKVCPDGSSVGRTGPNCEFSHCPTP